MPVTLPAYQPKAKCPKCGGRIIAVRFVGAGEPRQAWRGSLETIPEPHDVLRRACQTCGHSWDEAPLDTDAKEATP